MENLDIIKLPTADELMGIKRRKREHTIYGKISLILAITGLLAVFLIPIITLSLAPSYNFFPLYCSLLFSLGFFPIILGLFSYKINKPQDDYGKIAVGIGILLISWFLLGLIVYQYAS